MSLSDEQAAQLLEAAKNYRRIYVDSATVMELLGARKELSELRAKTEARAAPSPTGLDTPEPPK